MLQGTRNEWTMTFVASAAKALDLSPIMSATAVAHQHLTKPCDADKRQKLPFCVNVLNL
jgi:hypothetical protein